MRSSLADALRAFYQNQRWPLSALFLIVLLSRLPFLDAGYGANVDAWRVARWPTTLRRRVSIPFRAFPVILCKRLFAPGFGTAVQSC